jgi:Cd2+/Zn2+-exporting ATPase
MEIEADDMAEVKRVIGSIEPDVRLEKKSSGTDDFEFREEEFRSRRILMVVFLSATLFLAGVIFNSRLRSTPYAIAEYLVFSTAYLLCGWSVLASAFRNAIRGRILNEHFLMSIATLGAIAIHELPEAVGVMWFYKIGELFEGKALTRSRRSIRSLLRMRPDYASLKTERGVTKVPPERIKPGDTIVVRPGERIPLDGQILSGDSQVDTSPLTGETVPERVSSGSTVLAGMINRTGVLAVRATRSFEHSSIAKIMHLVESALNKKSQTENFITTFARYYTPLVVAVAAGIAVIPPVLVSGARFSEWVYRALVILVISCPCALVISIPLGYFGGVGGASRRGILVKGSRFLDILSKVKTVVFDKTGTLTRGIFHVVKVVPASDHIADDVLRMAAGAESHSNHPIAQSILHAYGKGRIDPSSVFDFEEKGGFGITAVVEGKQVVAGNDRLLRKTGIKHGRCDEEGTVVHVAIDGSYAGYIVIGDEIREDAARAVNELKSLGIRRVMMLTGDNADAAKTVASKLGMDSYKAGLLPEGKVEAIEMLIRQHSPKEKVAFVGDGINDAPVIARADVGIAMGGMGSDAAIETADVVIMGDAPSKVVQAIETARKTHRIVWENIIFALSVKGVFIILGMMGIARMWEAVFADMGVALIALFNAMRVLKR